MKIRRRLVGALALTALTLAYVPAYAAPVASCGAAPISAHHGVSFPGQTHQWLQAVASRQPWAFVGYSGAGFGTVWFCPVDTSHATIINGGADLTDGQACLFSSAMGATCRVRGSDGLPVELMHFGVE